MSFVHILSQVFNSSIEPYNTYSNIFLSFKRVRFITCIRKKPSALHHLNTFKVYYAYLESILDPFLELANSQAIVQFSQNKIKNIFKKCTVKNMQYFFMANVWNFDFFLHALQKAKENCIMVV